MRPQMFLQRLPVTASENKVAATLLIVVGVHWVKLPGTKSLPNPVTTICPSVTQEP
jgi:hypothetical protein